ncbi:hypothetical protein THICB2_470083 [Thiomonas sp. CB2]|nr:hypothetical protein THICB2_470083 [Thiomonas sp. CB2]
MRAPSSRCRACRGVKISSESAEWDTSVLAGGETPEGANAAASLAIAAQDTALNPSLSRVPERLIRRTRVARLAPSVSAQFQRHSPVRNTLRCGQSFCLSGTPGKGLRLRRPHDIAALS